MSYWDWSVPGHFKSDRPPCPGFWLEHGIVPFYSRQLSHVQEAQPDSF